MREKSGRRDQIRSVRLFNWRNRDFTSQFRDLHSGVSKLDSRSREIATGLTGLSEKVDALHTAVENHNTTLQDTAAYQVGLAYLSIFGSIAAAFFSLVAAVASVLDLNTMIFLLGSTAVFFAAGLLWTRLNDSESEGIKNEWV